MARRLFDSMQLHRVLEIENLEQITLGDPELTATQDGEHVVYAALVPFTGSVELLLAHPDNRKGGIDPRFMGLLGSDVEDGFIHLRSKPMEHATASADAGQTWMDLHLNNLRAAVASLNAEVAARRQHRADEAARTAAEAAKAADKVRAINEELESRKHLN